MFGDIFQVLMVTACGLVGSALILRIYLQWLGIDQRNPLSQFCLALTDWLVRGLSAFLPSRGRLDGASLLALLLVAFAYELGMLWLGRLTGVRPGLLLLAAMFTILRWALQLGFWLLLIGALISLVNPQAPLAPVVNVLTRPMLMPLRRLGLKTRGLDMSALLALLLITIALMVLDRVPL